MDAQDESLSRAIAASLEDAPGADYYETQPLEERIRKDARCVYTILLGPALLMHLLQACGTPADELTHGLRRFAPAVLVLRPSSPPCGRTMGTHVLREAIAAE